MNSLHIRRNFLKLVRRGLLIIMAIGVALLANVPPAFVANKGDRLYQDGYLSGSQSDYITSVGGQFKFVMQGDCNLVLYQGSTPL